MSGAFETAAGAFAVVGVADILVRMGRDLYSFLHDITGAPDEIARLRDVIQETVVLHQSSVQCQNNLKARGGPGGNDGTLQLLESASGALCRALQCLKLLLSRFRGARTWSRVKFVLNDSKIKKATSAIEQAKLLLTNSLTLACRKFSALGFTDMESLVRASFQEAGVETQNLFQSLETRLSAQYQDVLKTQNRNHQGLLAKLEQNQQESCANLNSIQRTLLLDRRTQVENWRHQKKCMHLLERDQKRTSASIRNLNNTVAKATDLDKLTGLVRQSLSLNQGAVRAKHSGRRIFFLGGRQDQIMAYLLPFQDDLEFAIDYIASQHPEEVSVDDADWLRSEFQHLIGSASQEKALQYPGSTATPLDQWSYSDDTVEYFKSAARKRQTLEISAPSRTFKEEDRERTEWTLQTPTSQYQRCWMAPTASGGMTISLPDRRGLSKEWNGPDEVGLCYIATHGRSKMRVRARFLRQLRPASQPRIHAHLNVFVEFQGSYDVYADLIRDKSLSEIYDALRTGTISPFHIRNDGYNLLLFYVTLYCRVDVFNFLETQGIGQSALNHDSSITHAIGCIRNNKLLVVEEAMNRSTDVLTFAVRAALVSSVQCRTQDDQIQDSLFVKSLRALRQGAFDHAQNENLLNCFAQRDPNQNCISMPRLKSLLAEADASCIDGVACAKRIRNLLFWCSKNHYNDDIMIRMLSAYYRRGIDVNHFDSEREPFSEYARDHGLWDLWCRTVKYRGTTSETTVS